MTSIHEIDERDFPVWLSRRRDGYRLHQGDQSVLIQNVLSERPGHVTLTIDGERHSAFVAIEGDKVHIQIGGINRTVTIHDPVRRLQKSSGSAATDVAPAPMPGTVVSHFVSVGDPIEKDQPLLVIESMKLETTIKAWRDGVVAELPYAKGDQFERAAPLVVLAPIGTEAG